MKHFASFYIILTVAIIAFAACGKDDGLDVAEPVSADGKTTEFQWVMSKHVETREQFRRNFGLGYSYDAVGGEYCNWRDIRCQVINRYFVEDQQRASAEQLLHINVQPSVSTKSTYSYSLRDYVANVNVNTDEEIDLGLYNGEKRKRQHFIEDGVQETIIYTLDETDIKVETYINYASVLGLYRKKPDMFTESFRNAVMHLDESFDSDFAAVDSFLNVWGTHVIVSASLGGKLCIDLKNYSWRYNDSTKTEEWSTEEFLHAVESKNEHRTGEVEFQWIEDSRLNIVAWGGDQSTLTGILGEHNADGTRQFSTKGISEWRNSLHYDPDDELGSNVELVDMRVVPIWEFVSAIDRWQGERVKAAVTQDAALQQKLLGNVNFFNASFPVRYPSAKCRWRKATGDWQTFTRDDSPSQPQVVNIVSGGRYIASVCHETIDGKDLWVCYPIYEGKINLACGVGVAADQTTYKVRWKDGKCTLTAQLAVAGSNFYVTGGSVGVKNNENVQYAESYALPYIELCGGVQPDGGYNAEAYCVVKQTDGFAINTGKSLAGLVGYSAKADGSYMRTDNYTYIYNPNEIDYE